METIMISTILVNICIGCFACVGLTTAISMIQSIINDLQDYIAQQTTHLTEFDESLVRRWIKQITIWDDRITVELKSGVNIDVDA